MDGSLEVAARTGCAGPRTGPRHQCRRSRRPRKPMPSPMSAIPIPRVSAGTARATGWGRAWSFCSWALVSRGGVRSGKGASVEAPKSSDRASSSSPSSPSGLSRSRSCSVFGSFSSPLLSPLSGSADGDAGRSGGCEAEPDGSPPLALGSVGSSGSVGSTSRDGSKAPGDEAPALAVVRPGRGLPARPDSRPATRTRSGRAAGRHAGIRAPRRTRGPRPTTGWRPRPRP